MPRPSPCACAPALNSPEWRFRSACHKLFPELKHEVLHAQALVEQYQYLPGQIVLKYMTADDRKDWLEAFAF